uniref:TSA: Wollemia nobilis Ref_Wollemi_Transcript_15443_1477 transcribed RNA sequence n=1 Tax=Wollemia nobilis TaxID=56998 RepID=A0A0C9S398_9CONI
MAASVECVNRVAAMDSEYVEWSLPREAESVLHALALNWGDVVDAKQLEITPLKGAMTNEVFQCIWKTRKGLKPRMALVRIYGEGVDLFFNREDEMKTFECMSRLGQGPSLLGRFPNGRIEEFLHARTLSASDLRDPKTSTRIAAKLREFHDLDVPGSREPQLWKRLRNWLRTAVNLCPRNEAVEFQLDRMEEEINDLEKKTSREDQRIGFCHNDLQYGNIMIDEEDKSVTIIDYEYASYNPVAYDFTNHFCEMAANYHTDTPHILDYSKYPGFEERRRFVKAYLSSQCEEANDAAVEQLLEDAEKYALASHIHWGLWGIISDHVNDIDFDYIDYARQRFQQYHLLKNLL